MDTLVISTGGINPSNRDAGFPNLAREKNELTIAEVSAVCRAELEAAEIIVHEFSWMDPRGEVPSRVIGECCRWKFERAWYYWVATGPGLPPDAAEKLHATHGQKVRVAGHCGCPSPLEWYKGFAVGDYHVDSPEGLKALADALRSVYVE